MPIVRSVRSAFHTAGVAAGALAVAAMLPLSAQAQNPPGDAPPSAAPEQASPTDDASVEVPYTEYVVVTATRHEADEFDLPYTVDVIGDTELRSRKLFRSVPDALRELPAVLVQKTAHGQGSPFIRGFTGFHTLFLVDGIRLNNSVFRSGPNQYWATVDPLSIQQLELVKGPSSVLYGTDAVGGTVNAITGPRLAWDEPGISARLYYRGASATATNVGTVDVSGTVSGKFGYYVRGAVKDFGDVTAGPPTGLQPNTGYDETDADGRLEYRFAPDSRLVFGFQKVNQNDVPRTHKTIFARSFKGTTVGNERRRDLDQDRELLYLQYHAGSFGPAIDHARFSLSSHRQEELRDRLRSPGRGGDLQGFDVVTYGFSGQLESISPVGYVTYGAEYYRDGVNSFTQKFDENGNLTAIGIQGPVADDSTYDLAGLYVQNEFSASERVDLIAGARYTYAAVDAGKVDIDGAQSAIADSWSSLVGNFRAGFRVDDRWRLFGGVAQGFRAPNLADLTKLDDTSAFEVPAPGLSPENFVSFEAGAKTRLAKGTGQIAYFYTLIDNLIVQSPTGQEINGTPVVRKDNIGDGFVHGIELQGLLALTPSWNVTGNFTWMRGEVDQFDEAAGFALVRAPLSRVMPITTNVGIRYAPPQRGYWTELFTTVAGAQDRLALRDITDTERIPPGGTPGYTVYTLRGGFEFSQHLSVSAALENVTDVDYRGHGSGSNQPGANFILGLELRR